MKHKKGPLDGIPHITPVSVEEIRKKIKEDDEARERKRNSPPETPTGKCVFCKGLVEAKHVRQYAQEPFGMRIGGPPLPFSWKCLGYHCVSCGLRYEFPPPELLPSESV